MQGLEGATPEQITDKTNCPRASWDVARTTIRKSVPYHPSPFRLVSK